MQRNAYDEIKAMLMMTSKILKFMDFTKTQKSQYLESFVSSNENLFDYTSRATL